MKKYLVAGVDLSLSSTGICMSKGDEVFSKAISFKSKKEVRLLEFYKQFNYLLTEGDIKLVVLENYAFNSLFSREALAELGGVFKLTCALKGILIILVPPTSLKKFVTGKGNSKKDEIKLQVYKKWKKEFSTSDEADAYVLLEIGKYLLNPELCQIKYEKDLIAKIEADLSISEKAILDDIRVQRG